MTQIKPIVRRFFLGVVLIASFSLSNKGWAQDGKALFQSNCASCHAVKKDLTGPALAGMESRWASKELLYKWIRNNQAVLATGDKYANELYLKWNKVAMNTFPNLADEEIDAIVSYVNEEASRADKPAGALTGTPDGAHGVDGNDNSLLYGVLTLMLAFIALILMFINNNLKKLSDEKDGIESAEPVPFYRNKMYMFIGIMILFIIGGYYVVNGAIDLGRSKDYQPVQPIYYSHKVHAGINQINCLYCHGGAMEGKQASIPAVNVCMNCHKAINEYTGEKLYGEDGKEINGTAEIQKLYKYAGWDPEAKSFTGSGKPIEWVRIHNLPDHVYFNHAQHVNVGEVQCQTCHGEVQKMDEVFQFTDLSMGWCINCHRTTKVQFTDNGFYSIYEKFHKDMQAGKMDSVTVKHIGGLECMKCHY